MEEDFQDVLLVNNFFIFLILMAKVLMAKVIKINLIVIKNVSCNYTYWHFNCPVC